MTNPEEQEGGAMPAPLDRARQILSERGQRIRGGAVRLLAREVIRQLSEAHAARQPAHAVDPSRVQALAGALVGTDPVVPSRMVAEAAEAGMDLPTIHQGLLSAAVRRLGEMWDDDRLTLTDMVVGCGRVYVLLRELRDHFLQAQPVRIDRPRALFATVPGELHTLGAVMAADHFRARGWHIDLNVGARQPEILAAARSHVIVVCAAHVPVSMLPLARLIVGLRMLNPAAFVMVAGRIAAAEPQIAALVDADAAAADLDDAEAQLDAALARLRPPSPQARR
jgi:methanogenic corrinoid protein MtbC1